jgi:periplasmic copper chaperone A
VKRALLALTAVCCAVVWVAAPASAHVTVTAPGATRGGSDQEITFRVPVERNADTVGLTVALPTATPIASVDVKPIPGWTHTQKTTKLAEPVKTDDGDITEVVSQISWRAEAGQGLKPGEYGEFTVIAGQLPDTSSLVFGAVQTYSDGSVVRWNQTAAPGSTLEPDFPAPTLTLSSPRPAAVTTTVVQRASTTGPTVLAVIALVVAAAALGIAVVGNARRKVAA